MTGSIFGQLALKDLYLTRWIVLGSIAAGAISLAMMPFDVVSFYVGSVSFVCVLIVLNIFLVTSNVMQEKKDKVRLFVLSLPISPAQYTLAKMAANLIAFLVPWLSLTAASLVVIAMTGIPDGLMPIAVAVSTYILSYFCVLLSVAIVSESQLWPSVMILIGNVSINLFIPALFRMPSARDHTSGDTAVWGSDILLSLALEVALAVLALGLAVVHESRRRDFV